MLTDIRLNRITYPNALLENGNAIIIFARRNDPNSPQSTTAGSGGKSNLMYLWLRCHEMSSRLPPARRKSPTVIAVLYSLNRSKLALPTRFGFPSLRTVITASSGMLLERCR